MSYSIIESCNTSFTYSNSEDLSLNNVSLSIKEGECVVLCGKSGSGKTTFSRLLNGLCPTYFQGELTGETIVNNFISGKNSIEEYVPFVGSVFQNPKTQYFNTNTTAELAFSCENMGLPSLEIQQKVEECISIFEIKDLMNKSIFNLSGGEKQRVAFASACVLNPKILVLDEPTSNLDYKAIAFLREMILKMKKQGVTIILAEHRLAWLNDIADKYYVFDNGSITHTWSAKEFNNVEQKKLHNLGLRARELGPYRKKLSNMRNSNYTQSNCFIDIKNLVIGYDKSKPVQTIESLRLEKGKIIGLMGYNGVGKSTFAKTLCGLQKTISGDIYLNNKKATSKDLIKNSFLVMQDVNYQLFSDSVKEEILLGNYNVEDCTEILKLLDLDLLSERHPMSLSGGQKQRVAIASAMISNKDLIVFDEPTSGLDYYHMMQVGQLLNYLKEQGKCVVVITHDEELSSSWCDYIITLENTDKENKYGI